MFMTGSSRALWGRAMPFDWTTIRTRADLPERGSICWVWCCTDGAPTWQVRLASRDPFRDGRWVAEDSGRGGRILEVYAWMPGPVAPPPPEDDDGS